jgi:RNA 2',3'-cyclic 3'-phosphodiesterase
LGDARAIEPIGWTVREFVLIDSLLGKTRYDVKGCWSLRGGAG